MMPHLLAQALSVIVTGFLQHKFPTIDLTVDDAKRNRAGLVVNIGLGKALDDFWLAQRRSPDPTSPLMRARATHGLVQLMFDGSQRVESVVTPEFVNVHHPLVSMGVAYWKSELAVPEMASLPISQITITGNPVDSGFGWFAVYVVTIHSVRPRSVLEVVVLHEQDQRPLPHLEAQLLKVIQELPSDASTGSILPDTVVEGWLDRCQNRMSDKRDEIQRQEQQSNLVRAEQQRRIRTASSATRINRWRSALELAENDAITRMNESQIRAEEVGLRRALDAIDERLTASVTYEAIAGGRVTILATGKSDSEQDRFRTLASSWVRR